MFKVKEKFRVVFLLSLFHSIFSLKVLKNAVQIFTYFTIKIHFRSKKEISRCFRKKMVKVHLLSFHKIML